MIEFLKPQYLFRPVQILRRLRRKLRPNTSSREVVRLPWGLDLEVDSRNDAVGRAIVNQGIYDIITTELLWRLVMPSDLVLDVGANIGYMTSVLAARARRVVAFEPHPDSYKLLKKNADSWLREVDVRQKALSDTAGEVYLNTDVRDASAAFLDGSSSGSGIRVETVKIDDGEWSGVIGLLKVDTERHEAKVLMGAEDHLRRHDIRDIVFEEHDPFPAESHKILMRHGYTIFWFEEHLMGPHMIDPRDHARKRVYDVPPSYLATVDPARVERLMSKRRWLSLSGRLP